MPMTRREFTKASAGTIAATTVTGLTPHLPRALGHQAEPLNWRRLNDKARVIEGMGGNALVMTSGEDALLVDTKIAAFGDALHRFVGSGGFNVTQVINTHHHADHTGGNFAWSADTPILAHEIARERVLKQHSTFSNSLKRGDPDATIPDADAFAPTHTTPGDTEISVGKHKIVLRHFGPGHTDNDLVVFIPDENILHAGDLLFHKMHIFLDLKSGASSKGWMANVDELIKMCDATTTVIAGHGPVTTRRGLEQQRDYIRSLREEVAKAIKDGKSRKEAQRLQIKGTEKYNMPRGLPNALNAIFTEMTGSED